MLSFIDFNSPIVLMLVVTIASVLTVALSKFLRRIAGAEDSKHPVWSAVALALADAIDEHADKAAILQAATKNAKALGNVDGVNAAEHLAQMFVKPEEPKS